MNFQTKYPKINLPINKKAPKMCKHNHKRTNKVNKGFKMMSYDSFMRFKEISLSRQKVNNKVKLLKYGGVRLNKKKKDIKMEKLTNFIK